MEETLLGQSGITLIEMIVVLGLVSVFLTLAGPRILDSFQFGVQDVREDAQNIAILLNTAQSNAASNRDNDNWGVRIMEDGTTSCDTTTASDCVVIYKGKDFDNRDTTYDQVYVLSGDTKFGVYSSIQEYTALKSCNTAVEVNGPGSGAWVNEANACDSDDADTQVNIFSPLTTEYLQLTDFQLEVPADATIDGITVVVERSGDTCTPADTQVQLVVDGTASGDDKSLSEDVPSSGDERKIYGGPSDTWGLSLSPVDINSANFGVILEYYESATCLGHIFVDDVQIRVNYTYDAVQQRDFYFNKISGYAKNLRGYPADPLLYYSFENATSVDYTGNGYYAVPSSTDAGTPEAPTIVTSTCARYSDCFAFDGAAKFLDVINPDTIIDSTTHEGGHTLAMWVKPQTSLSQVEVLGGLTVHPSWSTPSYIALTLNGAHVPGLYTACYDQDDCSGAGSQTVTSVSGALTIGEWVHLAGVVDLPNKEQRLYINGELDTSGNIKDIVDYAAMSRFYIGRGTSSAEAAYRFFDGQIDDVLLYDYPLSSFDIKQLYEFTKPTSTDNIDPVTLTLTNGTATSSVVINPDGSSYVQ